ncbi:hypothetical protein ACJX0J_010915 [Zea mays]
MQTEEGDFVQCCDSLYIGMMIRIRETWKNKYILSEKAFVSTLILLEAWVIFITIEIPNIQTIITQSIEDDENTFEAALDNDEAKDLDDNSDFSSPYNITVGMQQSQMISNFEDREAGLYIYQSVKIKTLSIYNLHYNKL